MRRRFRTRSNGHTGRESLRKKLKPQWKLASLWPCSHARVVGLFLFALIISVAHATPKRVLVIHSFVNAAPPFTTHSVAFETTLTEEMGEPVDLDEISLDMARYDDLQLHEALVEYMRKRHTQWKPDLVVPIGSPAGIFVAQFRERLFPETPIVYCGMDRRRLPLDALEKNAAFVGESFNLPGFVEDILAVAPATTNIAVVIGASPLEKFWASAFQEEFAPFTNRVSFTWLNDLTFDQMLDRVSKLPPRSFIFLILLMRDASGVTHNADEALKRIHAVANAPVNGIFQNQLGLGIVGGRLYQAEFEGQEAARLAVRILRGEPASSFPPKIVGPLNPRYDARELRRWGISESSLPSGSTVLFRGPTAWQRNAKWIILGASLFLAQGLLIVALIANLMKRRRTERSLEESESRFQSAADAAPMMIWMAGLDRGCTFFNRPRLAFTGRTLEQERGLGWADSVHPDDRQRRLDAFEDAFDAGQPFVMEYRLRRYDGEYRWVSDTGTPRRNLHGDFAGYVGSSVDVTESWNKTNALVESETRLRAILNTAIEGIITIDDHGIIESVNAATEKIFGYTPEEMIGQNIGMLMPLPFRMELDQYLTNYRRTLKPKIIGSGRELSGLRKDGTVFPIELAVSEILLEDRRIFTGFVRDITERKRAERVAREFGARLLQAQEAERARLARELHDDITQRLARLAIDAARANFEPNGVDRREVIEEMHTGLVRLSEDIHALSYRLHPAMLGDLGLVAAIKAECELFSKQFAIPTEAKLAEIPSVIPDEVALNLFRVAQEALRNVGRHGRSKIAEVSLRMLDDGLQLAVVDQGVGFDPRRQRERPSLGLASMQERMRLLGGELEIESAPGEGTTILAWVPLKR